MSNETRTVREALQAFHDDFEETRKSPFKRFRVFLRMHINRVIQSAKIVLTKPRIWRFVVEGFWNALVGGERSLRSLEVALTYRCNAHCSQCSCRLEFDPERERHEKLTLEEMKGAIDQAVELGAFQFCLNGGEPMLEEESVHALIRHIRSHGRYVHLCTNGFLLTPEKIGKLKECGLDSIEMGFDSAFEKNHDRNRVRGSYSKILENIRECRKAGIPVVLNTILTNDKVASDDIVMTFLMAKRLGCILQITPCCLTGAFRGRLDLMLTDDAKLYFHWLLAQSWNNRSDLYSSLTNIKCPAAREKIGLQPYGDVVSCPLIQIKYGNIRKDSLKSIRNEMLKNPFYHTQNAECLPSMSGRFIREYLSDGK